MIAFFPGQGSQTVGMGKELFNEFSSAREVFEEASDSIKLDLKKLCFEGPDSDLMLTENTQPAILTTSVAAFRVAQKELEFYPSVAAGHSLGEYSALVAIGALRLSDAVSWVQQRGRAMQNAVPQGEGTMAAIMGLSPEKVEELCQKATEAALEKRLPDSDAVETIVQPANFNAPGQVVIAGSKDAVDTALETIQDDSFKGGKAVPLQVSAPFHCKLMKPARDKMAEIFSNALPEQKPQTLVCPYLPNRTGLLTTEPEIIFELLIDQIDHPVLWEKTVKTLLEKGFEDAVEFGNGKVLQGLGKRIARQEKKPLKTELCGTPADLQKLEAFVLESQKERS